MLNGLKSKFIIEFRFRKASYLRFTSICNELHDFCFVWPQYVTPNGVRLVFANWSLFFICTIFNMGTFRGLLALRLASIMRYLIVDVAIGRYNSFFIWVAVIKWCFLRSLWLNCPAVHLFFFLLPRVSTFGEKFFTFVIKPFETPSKSLINSNVLPSL